MKTTDINDRSTFYASDNLLEELKAKIKPGETVVNFAYTDYGGSFFDKVLIAYFSKFHPENIVKETTVYFGENAFLFGETAREFLEAYEQYPLGFGTLEDFHSEMENDAEYESWESFLNDMQNYNEMKFDREAALSWLSENKGGYYSIQSSGAVDYCESDLMQEMIKAGIMQAGESESQTESE